MRSVTPVMEKVLGFVRPLFISCLRLPLNELTRKLLRRLRIAISQLAPNSWPAFIGAQILWGIMSEGQEALYLDEFLYCYKLICAPKAERMYYYKCRKRERQLVTKIPSSNRDWKEKFFFVLVSN